MFCFYFFISEHTFDDVFKPIRFTYEVKRKSVLRFLRFVCDFSMPFLGNYFLLTAFRFPRMAEPSLITREHSPSQFIYDKFHHKTEEFHLMFSLCLVLCLGYVCCVWVSVFPCICCSSEKMF